MSMAEIIQQAGGVALVGAGLDFVATKFISVTGESRMVFGQSFSAPVACAMGTGAAIFAAEVLHPWIEDNTSLETSAFVADYRTFVGPTLAGGLAVGFKKAAGSEGDDPMLLTFAKGAVTDIGARYVADSVLGLKTDKLRTK